MKDIFALLAIMAIADLENSNDTISNIEKNLDTLNDGSDAVTLDLTITNRTMKFVKVQGKWGAMTSRGSWEPFDIIPMCVIEEVNTNVQRVVDMQK